MSKVIPRTVTTFNGVTITLSDQEASHLLSLLGNTLHTVFRDSPIDLTRQALFAQLASVIRGG